MTAEQAGRARSFDAWAGEYDRYRPRYPDALFEEIRRRLAVPRRALVVDLGAGTGRASLAMAALGWRVTAVEPGKAMLDVLRAQAANQGLVLATMQATAEATGLDPAWADLVTAGQAFHWFDEGAAVVEMARILKPGGGVALFWNVRDEDRSAFVEEYHALLERWVGNAETGRYVQAGRSTGRDRTRRAFEQTSGFEIPELVELSHEVSMTPDDFLGMAFTASYVRGLPADDQERFRREVSDLLDRHAYRGSTPFVIPYRVDLWVARRRGG